ncbi:ATP-dependent helicase HepA [compost metagenome]
MSNLTELEQKVKDVYDILRDYQKVGFEFMVKNSSALNYDDMGLGKTLTTATVVMYQQAFPCIIVCPKSAMYVWADELMRWFGMESIVYVGKPKQREKLFQEFAGKGIKFIITNFSLVGELGERFGAIDKSKIRGSSKSGTPKTTTKPTTGTPKWKIGSVIADEIQLGGLFNQKTLTYKLFKQLRKSVDHMYLLTGTPSRKGAIDYFGPLSLIAPNTFDSYWKYVNEWCVTIDDGFGKSIERNPKDIVRFRGMLRQYAIIRKKTEVLHELPGKTRIKIPVEMDDEQAKLYRELEEDLMAMTENGELIMAPSQLALLGRLRQVLACPQVLGTKTRGAAVDALLEMAEDLVSKGKPFVVFSPYRKGLEILSEELQRAFAGTPIFRIEGGLTPTEFRDAWQGFQNGKGAAILLCVIKSGASFQATRADTAFFLGSEYDFNQNLQAEDRLNRMGQSNHVSCYYFIHRNTVDDHLYTILNDKKRSADLVLNNEQDFLKLLAKRMP